MSSVRTIRSEWSPHWNSLISARNFTISIYRTNLLCSIVRTFTATHVIIIYLLILRNIHRLIGGSDPYIKSGRVIHLLLRSNII